MMGQWHWRDKQLHRVAAVAPSQVTQNELSYLLLFLDQHSQFAFRVSVHSQPLCLASELEG